MANKTELENLTFSQVMESLKISRTGLNRLILKDKNFPRPIKLSDHQQGRVLFNKAEFLAYLESKKG